ncbi:MAG: hypothetical protein PHG45_03935 [Dehalococcoidales bacterium]|nr:hypothetical protein [Dehalococcoidales bacterium]
MSDKWQEYYSRLNTFIDSHTDIVVEPSRVVIPQSVRIEYYEHFNNVRKAFIREKHPNTTSDCLPLINEYKKTRDNVIQILELEKMTIDASLERFLINPVEELMVDLFHPLFDLLKGKIDFDYFESLCSDAITKSLHSYFKSGYELWVMLSLVQMLEPEKLLSVSMRQPSDVGAVVYLSDKNGIEVPPPAETKRLCIDITRKAPLMVPDLIIHSKILGKYISFRQQFNNSLTNATNASEAREWIPLESGIVNTGSILIFTAGDPVELALVGDAKKTCRPDIIIECRTTDDWYKINGNHNIDLNNKKILNPKFGSYIVTPRDIPSEIDIKDSTLEPTVKGLSDQFGEGSHIKPSGDVLVIGFDSSNLAPIIGNLTDQQKSSIE